jgi:hypothetical protein
MKTWEKNDPIEAALSGSAARMRKAVKEGTFDPNYVDEEGDTPLHVAFDPQVIREIIEAGGKINAKNSATGQTPLMEGAKFGQVEKVEVLLEAGADVSLRNHKDETALAQTHQTEIAKALIKRGILKHLDTEELRQLTSEELWGWEGAAEYEPIIIAVEKELRRRREDVVKSLQRGGDKGGMEI